MAGGGVPAGQVASNYGYATKLNFVVVVTCLIGATGGFLFGYDIGVTGGVTSMSSFLEKFFPSVAAKQQEASTTNYCEFDSQQLQIFTSSLFIVAAFVGIAAYKVNNWIGRRWTMCLAALCFFVGAVLDCVAVDLAMLVIGRCIMGVGVGLANGTVPLFIAEMAPPHARGALGNMFQLAVTIGILAAQLINYGVDKMHSHNNWRVAVGIAMVPAAILFFGSLIVSDTPHSLVNRGKNEAALKVLRRIRGTDQVSAEYEDIVAADQSFKSVKTPYLNIFRKKYRPELTVCVLMPFFQQFSGINSIMFYVPVLFRTIGSSSSSSLLSTVIIGAVNVVSTFVAIYVVDRAGRKFLFIEGGVQMLAADIVVAALLGSWLGNYNKLSHGQAILVIIFICVFVSAFAWSWGPLAWLVPAEIQPLATRQAGQSINVFVNFIFTFVIGQAFLSMLCSMRWGIFLFFACFVLISTIYIAMFVPETKGVPIERMPELWATHWFWKKFVPEMSSVPSAAVLVNTQNGNNLRKDVEMGAPNGAMAR